MTHYLVFAETGEFAGWGDESSISDVLCDFAGRPLVVLTPETGGGVLDGYVDHYDGEDCWAGIKYVPEIGKFYVEFCCDSSSDLDPIYSFENYYEAIEKAKELVR